MRMRTREVRMMRMKMRRGVMMRVRERRVVKRTKGMSRLEKSQTRDFQSRCLDWINLYT
jgi:hypothetical protein